MTEITIEVLNKPFQVKCPESEMALLQKAADYLDEKMRYFRAQGITEFEKIAIIAALNVTHELLTYDARKENSLQTIHERLLDLKNKIDCALQAENVS